MKRIYIISISLIILIIFFSCTVNESTGLIRVENTTHIPLKNVKIGNTLIVSYLSGGASYDYWHSVQIDGELITEGIEVESGDEDYTYHLKPGYWTFITASINQEGEEEVNITSHKNGTEYNETDSDDWRE